MKKIISALLFCAFIAVSASGQVSPSNDGDVFIKSGNWDEAAGVYQKLCAQMPSSENFNFLGIAYMGLQQYQNASAAFSRAASMDAKSAYLSNLALAHVYMNNLTEAEAQCRKALQVDPLSVSAKTNYGVILVKTNRHAEAEPVLSGVFAADKTNHCAAEYLGYSYYQRKDYYKAADMFERAVALRPSFERYLYSSYSYYKINNLEAAEMALVYAELIRANDPKVAQLRGLIEARRTGRFR